MEDVGSTQHTLLECEWSCRLLNNFFSLKCGRADFHYLSLFSYPTSMAVPAINDKINYIKVTVSESDDNTRALKWLTHRYRHIVQSKECCKRSFRRQEITVNGEHVEETRILHTGDVVEVRYDRARVEQEKLRSVPVDIRYQDEDIAIVWKASGQVSVFLLEHNILI